MSLMFLTVTDESTRSPTPTRELIIPPKKGSSHLEALLVEAPTDFKLKALPPLELTTRLLLPFLTELDVGLPGAKL